MENEITARLGGTDLSELEKEECCDAAIFPKIFQVSSPTSLSDLQAMQT